MANSICWCPDFAEFRDEDTDAADWSFVPEIPADCPGSGAMVAGDVELALIGEETEVDKTMIEDLADPLFT